MLTTVSPLRPKIYMRKMAVDVQKRMTRGSNRTACGGAGVDGEKVIGIDDTLR